MFADRYGGRYGNFFSGKLTGFHSHNSGVKLKEKQKGMENEFKIAGAASKLTP